MTYSVIMCKPLGSTIRVIRDDHNTYIDCEDLERSSVKYDPSSRVRLYSGRLYVPLNEIDDPRLTSVATSSFN